MPTDQPANEPASAPQAEAPRRTIEIIEETAPDRPYKTPPTMVSEEELTAPGPRQQAARMITDGNVVITAEGGRIMARRIGDAKPANVMVATPAPLCPRALSKREAEMEGGRRAVARATEQQAHRPPLVRSAAEIAAEGTNTPVFRPGDFREYPNMRGGNTSKDSGSSVLRRVQGTLQGE